MKLLRYTPHQAGMILESDEGTFLRLESWSPRILRLIYAKDPEAIITPPGALITAEPENLPISVTEENGEVVFSSGNAAVAVRRATFAVRLLVDGHEVSALSRWGMQLQDTEITTPHHTAVGGDGLHLVEQETEKR
ncbi:MAG: hypothetical protein MJ175_00850, partial [Clostridia bacterium]|nr:hypothetical protein [Clostridia bacterium]